MGGAPFDRAVALVVVELQDVFRRKACEHRREVVVLALRGDVRHGVAYRREELGLEGVQQTHRILDVPPVLREIGEVGDRIVGNPFNLEVVIGPGLEQVRVCREVVPQRLGELREGVGGFVQAGIVLQKLRRLADGELRHRRHARAVGVPREHDLLAQRLALALLRERGVLFQKIIQLFDAFRRVEVRHHPVRVLRGPVVAVVEARLHAGRLEPVEDHGLRLGVQVDHHPLAELAPLDPVLDGGRFTADGGVDPQTHRLVALDNGLGLPARIELLLFERPLPVRLLRRPGLLDRRVEPFPRGVDHVILALERLRIDALEVVLLDGVRHQLPVGCRKSENLRRREELAVQLADEPVLADLREVRDHRFDVADAKPLSELPARAEQTVERMFADLAELGHERLPERLHRGAVRLLVGVEHEGTEADGRPAALVLHDELAAVPPRVVG